MKITLKNKKKYGLKSDSIEKIQDYGLKVGFFKKRNNQLIQDYSCEIDPIKFQEDFNKQLNGKLITENLLKFKNYYIGNIISGNLWDELVLVKENLEEMKILKIKYISKYKEKCFKFGNKYYSISTLKLCEN